ncbi:MAG: S16 family serine protease [Candidatus Aenigmatarchaeota archaeon]|nr:hypothetical protein [Candidatus Aenigmarchaeota archaeon]
MKKFLLILVLLTIANVYAEEYSSSIKIIGVRTDGTGVEGNLTVEVQPGKGRILVDTYPLQGLFTQDSERTAVKVASEITKFDFSKYDVIYSISTPGVTNVDGPSAGAAMTIATIAAVQRKQISPAFSITGTIEEDHSIGKVGEIFAKARTAADSGVSLFLIPEGQRMQIQYTRKVRTPSPGWRIETIEPYSIDTIKYAKENWGMEIVEVGTIEEALEYAFKEIQPRRGFANYTLPEFELNFKSANEKYNQFDSFAKNAIQRGQSSYRKAESKLQSTYLPENVKQDLNYLLKQSKELLDEADKLLKSGYKYSAGNNGFKASVYSQTVIDLINYYSASNANKNLVIENKINQLKTELKETKPYVIEKVQGSICDKNQFEWSVIALQRITYAENRINNIDNEDVFNSFFDLNVADEWIKISKEFSDKIVITSNDKCQERFESKARNLIDQAENSINYLQSLNIYHSIDSYLDAAKTEYENGFYSVAIIDAYTAKARADALKNYNEKSIEKIYEDFNKTQMTPNNLISTIFYEHSMFSMYKAAVDSSDENAIESMQLLKSAEAVNEGYEYISSRIESESNIKTEIVIIILCALLTTSIIYIVILKSKTSIKKKRIVKKRLTIKK